jgi:hypothetical protein
MSSAESEKPKQVLYGRGHKKEKPLVRRIRQEHGTLILSLSAKLGVKLNQEVVIEKVGSNPLLWELKIKPVQAEKA